MKDFDRKILTKLECLHRDFLETKTKLCSSLTTTLSKLKILRVILYMEEMEKWIIFKEIIILLNSFLVYIFFVQHAGFSCIAGSWMMTYYFIAKHMIHNNLVL